MPGSAPPNHPPLNWTWRECSAVAAALVVGVLLGPSVLRSSQPLPLVSEGGRVVATGTLETALQTQRTGEIGRDAAGISIGMSFLNTAGQYCRSFATLRGPAGLACRERGDWVVEVLARNPRPRDGSAPEGYRQGGTPYPDVVRQAIANRLVGAPLDAALEQHAIELKWRAERVLKDASP